MSVTSKRSIQSEPFLSVFLSFIVIEKGRKKLGFPEWATVSDWLNQELYTRYPDPEIITLPEIKKLGNTGAR